jgi:methionyl-tRNA formyltransferase
MTDELDAGPVYLKKPLMLDGSAQKIFERAANLAFDMMDEIVVHAVQPAEQKGTPMVFKRRKPEQSLLPDDGTLEALYDHIRMLDADTYPVAFLRHGRFRLELRDAEFDDGRLVARVSIALMDGEPK